MVDHQGRVGLGLEDLEDPEDLVLVGLDLQGDLDSKACKVKSQVI